MVTTFKQYMLIGTALVGITGYTVSSARAYQRNIEQDLHAAIVQNSRIAGQMLIDASKAYREFRLP